MGERKREAKRGKEEKEMGQRPASPAAVAEARSHGLADPPGINVCIKSTH